jgi:RNA recognition motif-containing protein
VTPKGGDPVNIYVGNLSFQTTEDELKEAFLRFGNVSRAVVVKDRATGKSKGFGFVEMPDNVEAAAAIRRMDGSALKGRNLKVNEARPRESEGGAREGVRYNGR